MWWLHRPSKSVNPNEDLGARLEVSWGCRPPLSSVGKMESERLQLRNRFFLSRCSMPESLNPTLMSSTGSARRRRFSPYIISARLAGNSSRWIVRRQKKTKGKDSDHDGFSGAIKGAFSVRYQRSSIPLDCGWHAVVLYC